MNEIDSQPLLTLAAERDQEAGERTREIHARCVTMERACAAIGFAPGSCAERVAVLVARVAGDQSLRRTVREVAADSAVGFCARQVRRAIEHLERVGVLTCVREPSPPWSRAGRRPMIMQLAVNWPEVRSVVAAAENWRRQVPEIGAQNRSGQLGTRCGQDADKSGTRSGQDADRMRTTSGLLPDRSYISSLIPSSPSSLDPEPASGSDDDEALKASLAAAGVERTRSLLAEAASRRTSARELIDAAYVCQHWATLTPGALFDWVRSGGWPTSGVPPADVLRHSRRKAAESIRSSVLADAAQRTPEPHEHVIAAVICRRMRSTIPNGCKTNLSDEITREELSIETEINQLRVVV